MNTREINGSSWPITYFIAAAIPLTTVTVLTPLYALRIFHLITRLLQGDTRVRRYFKWGMFTLGISLALTSATLQTVRPGTAATAILSVSAIIAHFISFRYMFRFQPYLSSAISTLWRQTVGSGVPDNDQSQRQGGTTQTLNIRALGALCVCACWGLFFASYLLSYWILFALYVLYGLACFVVRRLTGPTQ
jgi:hypothetical protein